jgi:Flp pilus assembly pilin Flp
MAGPSVERKGAPMSRCASEILAHRGGTTAIEYSLIACLISIAIILGATAIGTTMSAQFYDALVNEM